MSITTLPLKKEIFGNIAFTIGVGGTRELNNQQGRSVYGYYPLTSEHISEVDCYLKRATGMKEIEPFHKVEVLNPFVDIRSYTSNFGSGMQTNIQLRIFAEKVNDLGQVDLAKFDNSKVRTAAIKSTARDTIDLISEYVDYSKLFGTLLFISAVPEYEVENDQRTDYILGYGITVISTTLNETFTVKIEAVDIDVKQFKTMDKVEFEKLRIASIFNNATKSEADKRDISFKAETFKKINNGSGFNPAATSKDNQKPQDNK